MSTPFRSFSTPPARLSARVPSTTKSFERVVLSTSSWWCTITVSVHERSQIRCQRLTFLCPRPPKHTSHPPSSYVLEAPTLTASCTAAPVDWVLAAIEVVVKDKVSHNRYTLPFCSPFPMVTTSVNKLQPQPQVTTSQLTSSGIRVQWLTFCRSSCHCKRRRRYKKLVSEWFKRKTTLTNLLESRWRLRRSLPGRRDERA